MLAHGTSPGRLEDTHRVFIESHIRRISVGWLETVLGLRVLLLV
jgi:hypothetical protein